MTLESESRAANTIAEVWHENTPGNLTLPQKRIASGFLIHSYVEGVKAGEFLPYIPNLDNGDTVRLLSIDLAYDDETVLQWLNALYEAVNDGKLSLPWLDPVGADLIETDPEKWADLLRARNGENGFNPFGLFQPGSKLTVSREITKIALIAGGSLITYLLLRDLLFRPYMRR